MSRTVDIPCYPDILSLLIIICITTVCLIKAMISQYDSLKRPDRFAFLNDAPPVQLVKLPLPFYFEYISSRVPLLCLRNRGVNN